MTRVIFGDGFDETSDTASGSADMDAFVGAHSRRHFLTTLGASAGALAAGPALAALLTEPASPAMARGPQKLRAASPAHAASTLTLAVFQNPDSLDPAVTGLITSGQILGNVFDPLIWHLPGHGHQQYFPGLAQSVHVSKGASVYTFKLRKGVTFHDGTPFDAHAVKTTFDHIANPATKSRSAAGALGPYKQTRVIDRYTAEISFHQPNAAFINEMTQPGTMGISSPTALKKYGSGYQRHPVGTGPFIFQNWTEGESVTVTANPHYRWGPKPLGGGKPPLLKKIVFRILPEHSAQYDALRTGEITIAQNLDPQDVQQILSAGNFHKFLAPSTGMPYCFMVNAAKAPTNNIRVRQALEYATNQNAVIKTLFFGLYEPANSLFCPTTPGYSHKQAMYSYNPKKAGQLLDAAGWKKGSNGMRSKHGQPLKLSLINISGFGFDGISQVLQAQFRDVGIDVSISDQSFPAVAATYNRGDQHLADFFYYDVDPYFTHALFDCGQIKSGFNWEHFCNPKIDAMINKANQTANTKKRTAMYQKIGTELMKEAVIIPIYNLRNVYVGPSSLRGLVFTVNAVPLFHHVTY